jgi:hypothetical protein
MILDAQLLFADGEEFDVATATPEASTNVYDSGPLTSGGAGFAENTGIPWGTGTPVYGHILVTTSFVGTNGLLEVRFVSDSALPLDASSSIHWTSGAIAETVLDAGYFRSFALPPDDDAPPYLRYIGFLMVASGANLTAGNLRIWISNNAEDAKNYATGMHLSDS